MVHIVGTHALPRRSGKIRLWARSSTAAVAAIFATWAACSHERLAFIGSCSACSRQPKAWRQSWAEDSRLVPAEGGAERAGPHPPKPLKFIFEGRTAGASSAGAGDDAEAPAESDATTSAVSGQEAPHTLRQMALARMSGKASSQELSLDNVRELADTASREAEQGSLQAEDLSASLRAIATFRQEAPELRAHIPIIADFLLGRAADLQATGTADALWAVAELQRDAPMTRALLPVLVVRLARNAPQLTVEETISSMWASAVLRKELQDSGLKMAPLLAYLSKQVADGGVKGLPMQVLAELLWSLAMLRTLPNEVLEVTAKLLVKEVQGRPVAEMNAHITYSMLYSVARLQDTCVHEEVRELLPQLREAMKTVAERMTPEMITSCLWSLGVADPKGADSQGLLSEIRTEVGAAVGELQLKELSVAIWSFAALQYRDKELLDLATDRFIVSQARLKPPLFARIIPRMAWAFAQLSYTSKPWFAVTAERLRPENHVIRYLGPDQLHALVWSLEKLFDRGMTKTTRDNLQAKLKKFIKMKYTHGLEKVTDRWGTRVVKRSTGRIEEYVEIDPDIRKEYRNAAMLKKAIELGEAGPDVPSVRRPLSGRPRWSRKLWVKDGERFSKALGSVYQAKLLEDPTAVGLATIEPGQSSGEEGADEAVENAEGERREDKVLEQGTG